MKIEEERHIVKFIVYTNKLLMLSNRTKKIKLNIRQYVITIFYLNVSFTVNHISVIKHVTFQVVFLCRGTFSASYNSINVSRIKGMTFMGETSRILSLASVAYARKLG